MRVQVLIEKKYSQPCARENTPVHFSTLYLHYLSSVLEYLDTRKITGMRKITGTLKITGIRKFTGIRKINSHFYHNCVVFSPAMITLKSWQNL